MTLVVLYKYKNCTVDKFTGTATGHTSYNNYISNYSIIIIIF